MSVEARSTRWSVIGSTLQVASPNKVGLLPLCNGRWAPPFRWCLLESYGVFLSCRFMYPLYVNLTCGPPFVLILITSVEIDNHQNLWNFVSDNPCS